MPGCSFVYCVPLNALKLSRTITILLCGGALVVALSSVVLASGPVEIAPADPGLVPSSLISLDNGDEQAYAIVVSKSDQRVRVYEQRDGLRLKHQFSCSTGEVPGKKERSGDRKTPEGVYFFTKSFEKRELSPVYGNGAFVLDYPNLLDVQLGRGGNNIWLHGSNKPIKDRDSNGCVVTDNDAFETLARYIDLNRTPVIIKEEIEMVPAERQFEQKESLTRFLKEWATALEDGSFQEYTACYNSPPEDADALWREWEQIRRSWQDAQVPFDISIRNLTLVRGNPCITALFDQIVELDGKTITAGRKKLFLEGDGKGWRIVADGYQPADAASGSSRPLLAAIHRMDRFLTDHKQIADVVSAWAAAWSSKDITRYRGLYSSDFHSRGMNLEQWIRYKKGLNARYKSIRVRVEDLKIDQGVEKGVATFLQRYDSNVHHSRGIKRLLLKRTGGTWKIYQETFKQIRG